MMRALVIPVDGPVRVVDMEEGAWLAQAQEVVGGLVQPVELNLRLLRGPLAGRWPTEVYVNEDAAGLRPNMRATDYVVPGVSILWGDCLCGDVLVCGFDPARGVHRDVCPAAERRARLVESEAS